MTSIALNEKSKALQERQLEGEQAAAAYDLEKNIAVTAGPGSGKTTVLVERYLHVLRQLEPSIDQIVAITFTNRAANEMRERLRARLNQILEAVPAPERRRWLHYKRTLDGAVITTIHGFCARLLREFPVEAQVDPQFLLLDEHRAAMLLETAVEETLSEFIRSGHLEISRLTLGVGRSKLAAALADLYRDARGQGLSFADLALKTAANHACEEDHARAVVELTAAIDGFLAAPRRSEAQFANQAAVREAWLALRSRMTCIPEVDELADYCRAIEDFRDVRPQARGALSTEVNFLDTLLWAKHFVGRVPQICLDLFAQQYALEVVNLLKSIDDRLNSEKQKLSVLDFDDLELRALKLLENRDVLTRCAKRYKFFLVDEFQDTNGLQRRLLENLALSPGAGNANLFIVGDRKQSIYGFRGADVDVFREMTATLVANQGQAKALPLNFRSQPPLINFFNQLFQRLFKPDKEIPEAELNELGYVAHEPSEARRELTGAEPLVELMITTTADTSEKKEAKADKAGRELEAQHLVQRINSLVSGLAGSTAQFSDIALLFRAMTDVQTYEAAFRRASIPYQTVLGRGFYEREEVTDLIQLLRFLDNKTDELALAAVLRSSLCGISDNALLALRCGPALADLKESDPLRRFSQIRRLLSALNRHREIDLISEEEHHALERASTLIKELLARRHHYTIGELLRYAVEKSEYLTVIATTFEGPQRLANVHRLFQLAERFERSGTHLIRDFVSYVKEFEAIGSRESEAQLDEATNAVRLMTIHQAKGLQFPIVIIPDLQRASKPFDSWVLLDRHLGLTLKVPDGRGMQVAAHTFNRFEARRHRREQFESMRLLYVAATRAADRLILSGTVTELDKLNGKNDSWLKWIWQSLELGERRESGIVDLGNQASLQFTLNLTGDTVKPQPMVTSSVAAGKLAQSLSDIFPLLQPLAVDRERPVYRFSVTQLINYRRCPRQYYFDRVVHVPPAEQPAARNDAEAPEPPANLTATLKGAVIHRFCETFARGSDPRLCLRASLDEIIRRRRAELLDRLVEIDREAAIKELLPLAENYLSSELFKRIESAPARGNGDSLPSDLNEPGLWSELSFRLGRPLGLLTGTIDKLLISRAPDRKQIQIEIIDFKTNRIRPGSSQRKRKAQVGTVVNAFSGPQVAASKLANSTVGQQLVMDFSPPQEVSIKRSDSSISESVSVIAHDYQLQMQAYALAVRMLLPDLALTPHDLRVTLHFLEPNVEFKLAEELLRLDCCVEAIDGAMHQLASSLEPVDFPVRPALHCRTCNFLGICNPGREWLAH